MPSALTPADSTLTGLVEALVAADATGNYFANDGEMVLHVQNASGSNKTVTVDSVAPCSYGFDHNAVVTIAAGAYEYIGPFPAVRFNDVSGFVQITYDAVTNVNVQVIRVAG